MDPPGGGWWPPQPPPSPRPSPRKELQLHGPRPSPLQVSPQSHKITKRPPPRPPLPQQLLPARPLPPRELMQPLIIYSVSPKVIHVEENKFMSTVQRLTGLSPGPVSGSGDVSPAARLASIERASPTERDRGGGGEMSLSDEDIMDILEGVDLGQFPGILSPAPAMMPPVPAVLFSPAAGGNGSQQSTSVWQDLSPFWHNSPSSSSFLSASIIFSPSPSSVDLFSLLEF